MPVALLISAAGFSEVCSCWSLILLHSLLGSLFAKTWRELWSISFLAWPVNLSWSRWNSIRWSFCSSDRSWCVAVPYVFAIREPPRVPYLWIFSVRAQVKKFEHCRSNSKKRRQASFNHFMQRLIKIECARVFRFASMIGAFWLPILFADHEDYFHTQNMAFSMLCYCWHCYYLLYD